MTPALVTPAWMVKAIARNMEWSVRALRCPEHRPNPARRGTIEHAYVQTQRFLDALSVIEAIGGASYPSLNRAAARLAVSA